MPISIEQQAVEDLRRCIIASRIILEQKNPGPVTSTMLYNQIQIMRFLLYVRTGRMEE